MKPFRNLVSNRSLQSHCLLPGLFTCFLQNADLILDGKHRHADIMAGFNQLILHGDWTISLSEIGQLDGAEIHFASWPKRDRDETKFSCEENPLSSLLHTD